MDWKSYQEQAAEFFRSLGLEAETDKAIQGVRTAHDVDVLVTSHHAGFDVKWIVECKLWETRVSKLHVLALREIVNDTGADRGILLAENGFQSGAIEAAELTNVHVTNLVDVTLTASTQICSMRLRELYGRIADSKRNYWDISKEKRILHGLRPDSGGFGYSGDVASKVAEKICGNGLRGVFPFPIDIYDQVISTNLIGFKLPPEVKTISEASAIVEMIVLTLEEKIDVCRSS